MIPGSTQRRLHAVQYVPHHGHSSTPSHPQLRITSVVSEHHLLLVRKSGCRSYESLRPMRRFKEVGTNLPLCPIPSQNGHFLKSDPTAKPNSGTSYAHLGLLGDEVGALPGTSEAHAALRVPRDNLAIASPHRCIPRTSKGNKPTSKHRSQDASQNDRKIQPNTLGPPPRANTRRFIY